MKKCSKCGLVQDDRRQCIDCGAFLDKTLSAAEEELYRDEVSDAVREMSDRCVDFYVSPKQRWFGLGAVAATILSVVIFILGAKFTPNSGSVALYSSFGLILSTTAALHLLFPRAMWNLETFRFRFHVNGEFSPSDNYLVVTKFISYVCFGAGAMAAVWSLVKFIIQVQ